MTSQHPQKVALVRHVYYDFHTKQWSQTVEQVCKAPKRNISLTVSLANCFWASRFQQNNQYIKLRVNLPHTWSCRHFFRKCPQPSWIFSPAAACPHRLSQQLWGTQNTRPSSAPHLHKVPLTATSFMLLSLINGNSRVSRNAANDTRGNDSAAVKPGVKEAVDLLEPRIKVTRSD